MTSDTILRAVDLGTIATALLIIAAAVLVYVSRSPRKSTKK